MHYYYINNLLLHHVAMLYSSLMCVSQGFIPSPRPVLSWVADVLRSFWHTAIISLHFYLDLSSGPVTWMINQLLTCVQPCVQQTRHHRPLPPQSCHVHLDAVTRAFGSLGGCILLYTDHRFHRSLVGIWALLVLGDRVTDPFVWPLSGPVYQTDQHWHLCRLHRSTLRSLNNSPVFPKYEHWHPNTVQSYMSCGKSCIWTTIYSGKAKDSEFICLFFCTILVVWIWTSLVIQNLFDDWWYQISKSRGVQYVHCVMHKCVMAKLRGKR